MDKQFLVDLGSNSAGVLEGALPMVTGAVAEPVAGLAALYHAATGGHDASGVVSAIRDAMTYQPRTDAGKMLILLVSIPRQRARCCRRFRQRLGQLQG